MPEISEWRFIWAAYTVTWVVLASYIFHITSRLRRALRRKLDVESQSGGDT